MVGQFCRIVSYRPWGNHCGELGSAGIAGELAAELGLSVDRVVVPSEIALAENPVLAAAVGSGAGQDWRLV